MKKKSIVALMVIGVLCVLLAGTAFAATTSSAASTLRLESTQGSVAVKNAGGASVGVTAGMRLYSGYTVTTEAKSYAYISLDNSKAIKLDASTKAKVIQSGKKLEVQLISGKMLFNVKAPVKSNESMNVRTSTMMTGVRGTSAWVEATEDGERIYMLEGTVYLTFRDTEDALQNAVLTAGYFAYRPYGDHNDWENVRIGTYTEADIPGFVKVEIAKDPDWQTKIRSKSTLKVESIVEDADEALEKDEAAAEEYEKQLEQQIKTLTDDIAESAEKEAANNGPIRTGGGGGGSSAKTYTVTFVVDGEPYTTLPVNRGESLEKMPGVPEKEGYDGEWDVRSVTNVTKDITVTAVYTIKQYAIEFVADGEPVTTEYADHGSSFTDFPAVPEKEGYTGEWDVKVLENVTEDKTVTAVYTIKQYAIEFVADGEPVTTEYAEHGSSFTDFPAVPEKEGYTGEWDVKILENVTEDKTVTAVYTPVSFSVTFIADGVTVDTLTVNYGESLYDIPTPPEKTGYDAAWDADDFTNITSDMTVAAVYTVKTFTVTLPGGEGYLASFEDGTTEKTVEYGDPLSFTVDLVRFDDSGETIPLWQPMFGDDFCVEAAMGAEPAVLNIDATGAVPMYGIDAVTDDVEITVSGLAAYVDTVENHGMLDEVVAFVSGDTAYDRIVIENGYMEFTDDYAVPNGVTIDLRSGTFAVLGEDEAGNIGNVTINGGYILGEAVESSIGGILTISEMGAMTLNGIVNVAGEMHADGLLTIGSTSTLVINADSDTERGLLQISGTVVTEEYGSLALYGDCTNLGTFENNGTLELNLSDFGPGAFRNNGKFINGETGNLGMYYGVFYQEEDGEIVNNNPTWEYSIVTGTTSSEKTVEWTITT